MWARKEKKKCTEAATRSMDRREYQITWIVMAKPNSRQRQFKAPSL